MKKGNGFIMMSDRERKIKMVINLYKLEQRKADEKLVKQLSLLVYGVSFYIGMVLGYKKR